MTSPLSLAPGSYTVSCYATDSQGLRSETAQFTITVQKAAPVLSELSASPAGRLAANQEVTVSGTFTDVDAGADAAYTGLATWSDGTTTPASIARKSDGSGWTVAAKQTLSGGGVYSVALKVTDSSDASSFAEKQLSNITVNYVPGAPGVPHTGDTTNQGAFTLIWDAAMDQDAGDSVKYTLEGKTAASDATWQTIAPNLTTASYSFTEQTRAPEGTWTYRVRANDGLNDGASSRASAGIKVDRSGPTAPTATISGTANSEGWYKDSVTVSYAGSDDPSLPDGSTGSGVVFHSAAQTLSTTGSNDYSGFATDNAGNKGEVRAGTVRVDAAAPTVTITGCPQTKIAFGAAVSVNWTASDEGSGLEGAASGTQALDTNTAGSKTVKITATDKVGHTKEATCTYTVNAVPQAPGAPSTDKTTNQGTFTLSWTPAQDDDDSALKYTLEGKRANESAWTVIASDLSATSYDFSNAPEGTWTYRVRASDGLNESGNAQASGGVKVDRSKPTAPTATPEGTLLNGWYKNTVKFSYAGSTDPDLADGSVGSGVASYRAPQTFSTTGGHDYSGTATDNAGNISSATGGTVKVDATAPIVTITDCPKTKVAFGAAVSVNWTASDEGSGLDGAAAGAQALDTSTPGSHTVEITAADKVGLTAEAASCTYTVNAVPQAPGAPSTRDTINQGTFTLSWAASTDADNDDALKYTLEGKRANESAWTTIASNLDAASYAVSNAAEGTWTYRVRASDGLNESGNSASSAEIKVDRSGPTAPTASLSGTPNSGGWYKDTVTVSYGGSTDPKLPDGSAGSGVASYSAAQTFSTTGTSSYSGTATDGAKNVSSVTSGTVQVDATAPTVSITCPQNPVTLGSPAVANWTARDDESGLTGAPSGTVTLTTTSVTDGGVARKATISVTDKVGHSNSASCNYTVVYDFKGFFQPVDMGSVFNRAKAGSAIPVKFTLGSVNSLNVLAPSTTASPNPSAVSFTCSTGASDDIEQTVTANASGLQWDSAAQQYVYVWKTSTSYAGQCVKLNVRFQDGTTQSALFQFTK